MRTIKTPERALRIIYEAIEKLELDLNGISVLTEAASGPFAVTPLIAALAGSDKVVSVGKDSPYGTFQEVKTHIEGLAVCFNAPDTIDIVDGDPTDFAPQAQLVTNLGFLRPITSAFISKLPDDAAVSLMWEPWEYRPEDVDLDACQKYGVPILGTNEKDHRLDIFRYVGILALKLLFEKELEVFKSKILVIGSGVFGEETCSVLSSVGADVFCWSPGQDEGEANHFLKNFLTNCDAIVLVEHHAKTKVIGGNYGLPLDWFKGLNLPLIHICGDFDQKLLSLGPYKYPERQVSSGYMTVTTDYVGLRPVIDLHAAGLKVGAEMIRGMRRFHDVQKAKTYALENSPAKDWL